MIASLITFCSFILLSSSFTKHTGMQCWGAGGNSDSDIERDYVGTADECKAHCAELDVCVGFVRVITGSQYAGKCFFRSGPLGDPFAWSSDTRDCYVNDGCSATSTETIDVVPQSIYACRGTFSVQGLQSTGANSAGALCDTGYHVCNSAAEAESLGLTADICNGVTSANELFATKETSTGSLHCYSKPTTDQSLKGKDNYWNDIWGCGGSVFTFSGADDCLSLTAWYGNKLLQGFHGWSYVTTAGRMESAEATLSAESGGGVLCCADSACEAVGASYSPAHSCACKETCSGQYCRAIGVVEFSLTGAVTGAGRCDVAGTSCCCSCRDCVPFYGYL
eukprot:242604_1